MFSTRRALLPLLALLSTALIPFAPDLEAKPKQRASMEFAELEPFVVKGEELSITVFARSNSERNYAERMAEWVVEIAYETMGKSTGHGLVIVGDDNAPHPIHVFTKFLEMADANSIRPDMQTSAAELKTLLDQWRERFDMGNDDEEKNKDDFDIDFDKVVNAIPLPLEGIASSLFLVAWNESLEPEAISSRLATLAPQDLNTEDFSKYDWVFYLPPRNAFKQALKEILPEAMKQAEMGFFKRMALRGAVAAFKPLIRDAIEGVRKGFLYYTVLHSQSGYSEPDIKHLSGAFLEALMPHGKIIPGQKRERAIEAIEAQMKENEEYAKHPFVSPEPLPDPDFSNYQRFVGEYGRGKKPTHHFAVSDKGCTWQYLDWEPGVFHPAGDALFVSEDGKMTIEFLLDENGEIKEILEQWDRRRNVVPARG